MVRRFDDLLVKAPDHMKASIEEPTALSSYESRFLLHELHLLCQLSAQRMYEHSDFTYITADTAMVYTYLQRISRGTHLRIQLLHQTVETLQQNMLLDENLPLPGITIRDDYTLYEASRLALSIATHLTLYTRHTTLLRSFTEALDALTLMVFATSEMSIELRHFAALIERPTTGLQTRRVINFLLERLRWQPIVNALHALENQLPSESASEGQLNFVTQDWTQALLVLAAEPHLHDEASKWRGTRAPNSFIISDDEFDLVDLTTIQSWRQAAGDTAQNQTGAS